MRYKIAAGLVLLCVILVVERPSLHAQAGHYREYLVDSSFRFFGRVRHRSDSKLSVEAPNSLYASNRLSKLELSRILPDYDPERSTVKLYGYYTLRYAKGSKQQQQRIRVPYYSFQGSPATYSLDSVVQRGDTFTFRFEIPAPRGHSYEVSLNWNAGKIIEARYTGQGTAGSFTMCLDHAGQAIGTTVVLDHVRPTGTCFEMFYEYEDTHFIGRGISPGNRHELIVADEDLNLLLSYQLRYKIGSIEAGDAFYVIFDDARLKGELAEVPVSRVIAEKRYLR